VDHGEVLVREVGVVDPDGAFPAGGLFGGWPVRARASGQPQDQIGAPIRKGRGNRSC
jgi:hypothetical protein